MKKLFYLIFALSNSLFLSAQSSDASDLLVSLNQYRSKKGLAKVSYSKELSEAARYQAVYLDKSIAQLKEWNMKISLDNVGHDQKIDLPNWVEYSFEERCALLRKNNFEVVGEVIEIGGGEEGIIQSLHNSEPHRKIMQCKECKLVGIGIIGSNNVIVFGNQQ